jgi:hypothetical protein
MFGSPLVVRSFLPLNFIVLLHDHRTFGASGGELRHGVDDGESLPIGVALSHICKADPKSIRIASDLMARAMLQGARLC